MRGRLPLFLAIALIVALGATACGEGEGAQLQEVNQQLEEQQQQIDQLQQQIQQQQEQIGDLQQQIQEQQQGGEVIEGQEQQGRGDEEAAVFGDFNDFDANNDDELSQQEFDRGIFENLDTDDSGSIDENEFNIAPDSVGNFTEFDTNNDGELTQQEFSEGATDAGLFGEWNTDNDNVIDQDEFNEGASQL